MSLTEVRTEPQIEGRDPLPPFLNRFLLIFTTGFSELKRKGAVTRLHFEIKALERDKEKYVQALGVRAWEAHITHPDLSATLVNLKELQIEMNRLKTQFGEHDTEMKDIESAKTDLTKTFNEGLDVLDQRIVPHRERIESINAEKESDKNQIEDLRSKQERLLQQVRVHQQNIQEFSLGDDAEKESKISAERAAITRLYSERAEVDCALPLLLAQVDRLTRELAAERSKIEKIEQERDSSKRDYEARIKEWNAQIQQLAEKKRQASKQMEHYRKEMEPFLYELGHRVETLRLQEHLFTENFEQLDSINGEIDTRQKQILEAESLSRAMDRTAWTQFLVFSVSMFLLVIGGVFMLLN